MGSLNGDCPFLEPYCPADQTLQRPTKQDEQGGHLTRVDLQSRLLGKSFAADEIREAQQKGSLKKTQQD